MGEVDYALLPFENSLGGSIHVNYDLILRYSLKVVAELDFRVEHSLLALPGVKKEDIKRVISHPQALAQCDGYIRKWGATPECVYDTAGAAKMIREQGLTDTAAVASDLAGETYNLNVLDYNIEDDGTNFTRFLLLSRDSIRPEVAQKTECKTSLVFSLVNQTSILFKALSAFAMRDIDLTKIESRPGKPALFNKESEGGNGNAAGVTKYQYLFYIDFAGHPDEPNVANALRHLDEMATFSQVLGCYPTRGNLMPPIAAAIANSPIPATVSSTSAVPELGDNGGVSALAGEAPGRKRLKIGIVGFGTFGQFMAKTFLKLAQDFC